MPISSRISAAVGVSLSLFGASAMAAVPAVVGTTLTQIQTDAMDVIDLVWPVLLIILGAFLVMKIAKRAISKI